MVSVEAEAFAVVERVIQLLDEGSFTATYKYAVLLGLINVCLQQADRHGAPPQSITTRQLAEAVISLYWPQTRPWARAGVDILRQNSSVDTEVGAGTIAGMILAFRHEIEGLSGQTIPLVRAEMLGPLGWRKLVHKVEAKLIEMPLPKLQRIAKVNTEWLYTIRFDDGDHRPSVRALRAYQTGLLSDFDNGIYLKPGVGEAFVRLAAVLRPFIEHKWTAKVAQLNKLDERVLPEFLFGQERENLEPVRRPLVELQRGRCFYCDGPLAKGEVHVDHFLPWARLPENGLANLVAADGQCNGSKRDYLAHPPLVMRWRERMERNAAELAAISREQKWELATDRALGAARALYLPLPSEYRLWSGRSSFALLDRGALADALA